MADSVYPMKVEFSELDFVMTSEKLHVSTHVAPFTHKYDITKKFSHSVLPLWNIYWRKINKEDGNPRSGLFSGLTSLAKYHSVLGRTLSYHYPEIIYANTFYSLLFLREYFLVHPQWQRAVQENPTIWRKAKLMLCHFKLFPAFREISP